MNSLQNKKNIYTRKSIKTEVQDWEMLAVILKKEIYISQSKTFSHTTSIQHIRRLDKT